MQLDGLRTLGWEDCNKTSCDVRLVVTGFLRGRPRPLLGSTDFEISGVLITFGCCVNTEVETNGVETLLLIVEIVPKDQI